MDDFFCAIVAQSPVLPHWNHESFEACVFFHMIHDMICLFHDTTIRLSTSPD